MHQTVSYDQDTILEAIRDLWLGGAPVEVDPMYGKGGFYRGKFPQPVYISDVGADGFGPAAIVDARHLPFKDGSRRSIILDPPFMHAQGKESGMKRYTSYPSQKALQVFYGELLDEAARVLMPGGTLIFKTQDTVESGKQVWTHIAVHDMAVRRGFKPVDLFILAARSRMTGHNHQRQVHARKHHSYFWIFKRNAPKKVRELPTVTDANGTVWQQVALPVGW